MTRLAGHDVPMEEITTVRRRLRERTAEEVRVILARRRMSAAELARLAGIKQSTMARRMTGETAFDLDDLERVADVLGISVADLIPREVEPNERSDVSTERPSAHIATVKSSPDRMSRRRPKARQSPARPIAA